MANAPGLALDDRSDFDVPVDQRETSADRNLLQQTVGQELRAARLRKGITPQVIWHAIKIAPHHLSAIEEGCFDSLPGRVYVVGFVRSYARYLGLDVEKCLARLKSELPGTAIQPASAIGSVSQFEPDTRFAAAPVESVNTNEGDIGLFAPRERVEISPERGMQQYVVMGLIIAVLVYGGYNVFSSARLTAPSAVAPVPARLATEAGISSTKAKTPMLVVQRQAPHAAPAAVTITPAVLDPSSAISVQPLASIEPAPSLAAAPPKLAPPTEALTINPDLARQGTKNEPALRPAEAGSALAMRSQTTIERLPDLTPKPHVGSTDVTGASAIPARPGSKTEPTAALPSGPVSIASAEVTSLGASAAEQGPKFRPQLPLGTRYGLENGNSRVVLRLHRSIRIAVKGSHNHIFIDRILGAGATYRVPNTPGVKLTVPDAGAVEVILDGNTVGFAGRDGRAAKSLGLDPPSIIRRYHWQ